MHSLSRLELFSINDNSAKNKKKSNLEKKSNFHRHNHVITVLIRRIFYKNR